jgi:ACT domain-containing protein
MSLTVTKVDVWAAEIDDSPGGLAKLLSALADAGANLDCVIARRDHSKPDKGVTFLTCRRNIAACPPRAEALNSAEYLGLIVKNQDTVISCMSILAILISSPERLSKNFLDFNRLPRLLV